MNEETNLNWEMAFEHFTNARQQYQKMAGLPFVNTSFALEYVFRPLAERYENGERSAELFEGMMNVE